MLVADICMPCAKSVFNLFHIDIEPLAAIFGVEVARHDGGFYPLHSLARELRPNMAAVCFRLSCADRRSERSTGGWADGAWAAGIDFSQSAFLGGSRSDLSAIVHHRWFCRAGGWRRCFHQDECLYFAERAEMRELLV